MQSFTLQRPFLHRTAPGSEWCGERNRYVRPVVLQDGGWEIKMKTAFLKRLLSVLTVLSLLAGCFSEVVYASQNGSPVLIGILVSSPEDENEAEEEKNHDEDLSEKAAAALDVSLSLTPSEDVSAGDLLIGTVVVENTGNVTLKNGSLRGSLVDLTGRSFILAPGEKEEFRYQYMVSQADVDAGIVKDTVTASAEAVRGSDPEERNAEASAAVKKTESVLAISAEADNTEAGKGDVVTFILTAVNSGDVTIRNIVLEDALIPADEAPKAFSLAPGEKKAFTFTYTITEDDVKAGKIERTVRAAGEDPSGQAVSASGAVSVTAEAKETALTVLKTAEPAENVTAGDEISYKVVVLNTGTGTVTGIRLADPQMPDGKASETFSLEAGASREFDFVYTASQEDMDAGVVVSTAAVSWEGEGGSRISRSGSAAVRMAAAKAAMTAFMRVDPRSEVNLGQEVSYTVIVANIGNVTLKNGRLTEDFAGFEDNSFELAPGSTAEFSFTKTAVQEDMDRGAVISTVRVNAEAVRDENPAEAVTSASSETVKNGHLKVRLKAVNKARDVDGFVIGEKPAYKITVTNDGNMSLRNILVTDSLTGGKWVIGILKPGEKRVFTTEYTVSGADVQKGSIVNQVTAAGSCAAKNLPEVKATSKAVRSDTLNPNITLTLNKVWADDDNRDGLRPSSVDFILLLNGKTELATITLDEEMQWTTMIADLPKRFNGVKANYSWREKEVDGYTSTVEQVGEITTFTNTHEAETYVMSIAIAWDDEGRQARPSSLSMVLSSSEDSRIVTLSGANNWESEISVPRYANGKELTYTWIRPEVAGYTLSDVSEDGNETVMTNTRVARTEDDAQSHTLKVTYRYLDGSEAAPAYEGVYAAGGSYYVQSPDVPGFTPDKRNITGTVQSGDVEVVVLYLPGEDLISIEEYKTPLGLGRTYVNTGDCIE